MLCYLGQVTLKTHLLEGGQAQIILKRHAHMCIFDKTGNTLVSA